MQQLGDVQQNNQAAFELTHSGDIAGFTVGEDGTGRFNFGGRNFQDFRSGVDDQSDQFAVKLDNQNAIFLVVLNVGLAKTLAQVHHRNNFATKIDDPFDGIGSVGNRGEFRHAHLFHRAHNGLRAAGLFFDGGINFLGDFGEAVGGFGNLSGANRLFVGGSADFLGKFVNFGDHAGDLVESGTEVVAEAEALFNDAGAAIHVFDGLARFPLNAGNQFS